MGRASKWGLPPLRQYWRECNRHDRAIAVWERAQRKASDKKRLKCRCDAYKFPHRPGGGVCRYPDPPAVRWQDSQAADIAARVEKFRERHGEPKAEQLADLIALTAKPFRPYRNRYAGLRRQIARANGLHPIRGRALITELLGRTLWQAKQLHRDCPRKWKYRNMQVEVEGNTIRVTGQWQTAGPMM